MQDSFYKHLSFLNWKRGTCLFWGLTAVFSAIVLVTVFTSIWSGAGYNDEAWLVLMVKNQANGFWTSFAHYYRFMRGWGLASMRGGVAVLHGIACGLFVWGVMDYYKPFEKKLFLHAAGLWSVSALLPQIFWLGGIVLAPDYKFVAYDCALAGTGFLFLGMGNSIWLLLSGAFFAQLLFSLPQTGIIAPFVMLAICLSSWKRLWIFILGGLLGVAFFFLCVSSWESFQQCFLYSGNRLANTHGQNRHGVGMMITGYCKILVVFLEVIIPAALALHGSRQIKGKRGFWIWIGIFFCMLGAFVLGTMRLISWKSAGCPACSLDVFLILFATVALPWLSPENWSREAACKAVLAALFLIIPVAFCTGTDKGFGNRLTFYIGMLLVGTVVFLSRFRDRRLLWCLNLFLGLSFMAGIVYWKQSSGLSLLPHTINAQSVGLPADAPVTKQMAEHLKKIKAYADNAKVIINDPCHWYVPWLLEKDMLHLTSFRYYQFDDVAAMVADKHLNASDVLMLESPEYVLSEELLDGIQKELNASRRERVVLSEGHHIIKFY